MINNPNLTNEDIKNVYPDVKWVIFNNFICNLTNFSHPGG